MVRKRSRSAQAQVLVWVRRAKLVLAAPHIPCHITTLCSASRKNGSSVSNQGRLAAQYICAPSMTTSVEAVAGGALTTPPSARHFWP